MNVGNRAAFLFATFASLSAVPAGAQRPLLGYSPAGAARQHAIEHRFRSGVSADSLSALHLPLTQRPHPAGSAGATAVVQRLRRELESFGLGVETFDYRAWLSHPRRVEVSITAPTPRTLLVREPALAADPTSSHAELGDGYIAYSASGNVEGEVVYANYGLPADYAELERRGVSPRGRIVLARYGRSHRAVKVHTAQESGALALVLYSDPADDGFVRGPAWPEGYWRGEAMLQRGNAKMSWFFHGDPLTPGVAALPGAARLDPTTAPTLPRIPVVALSWGEARHLLSAIGGPLASPAFAGGVPTPYRLGPGAVRVRVTVDVNNALGNITNVVASLRGQRHPDRVVLLGTHHDAWTFGGVDPGTGMAALLEVARGLGAMARDGWRPDRTISLAFWDAEEFGLVGSTEFVEQWRDRLRRELLAYINTDMYMRGRFDAGGVPSLRDFVADVARDVPEGDSTVFDGWRASEWRRTPLERRPRSMAGWLPALKALGSGADFVPFQDHLGVATLSIEFIGANNYGFGTYHTNYDSRAYVERVADPGFRQGVTMSQLLGTMALRMANAEVLPFRFSQYASTLLEAARDAERWVQTAGLPSSSLEGVRALQPRVAAIASRATALEALLDSALSSGRLTPEVQSTVNDALAGLEQVLADDDGAPESRWYRHVFYGWNIYSLYDGQPFPGLAEGVRLRDAGRVSHEVGRISRALDRLSVALDQIRGQVASARAR